MWLYYISLFKTDKFKYTFDKTKPVDVVENIGLIHQERNCT